MYTISNDSLEIRIAAKGAELNRLYNKRSAIDYLWSGDARYWGKKSPVLFPIVGSLKNNSYKFEDKNYRMARHGFARDMEFRLTAQKQEEIILTLQSNEQTLQQFPFLFSFSIRYRIENTTLFAEYKIENPAAATLYFSVGGHPAFRLPFTPESKYEDYYLQFNKPETTGKWPISKDGLIENESIPLLEKADRLPLTKELFYKDALVLKGLQSTMVRLVSGSSSAGLDFDFTGFPFLGIWSVKDAPFVCIEPWCGIADHVDSNQELVSKTGINSLPGYGEFKRTWSLTLF